MSSADSGIADAMSTPRRIQKRLFEGGSSSKRNLFQTKSPGGAKTPQSGYESDLGPMSPLALSDKGSSVGSSPGRSYHSPLTTPESSPRHWDRLRPISRENYRLTPFTSLKKITNHARGSPSRRIFMNSPKSIPGTPERVIRNQIIPGTPDSSETMMTDDIIPETPQKDYITETPKSKRNPEKRLITPLGSVCKSIVVPPLHRRKSLGPMDETSSSPERNSLKRHHDESHSAGAKIQKSDDSMTISRARASLFPEEKSENARPKFTLSAKSFYKKSPENKRYSLCFAIKTETESKPRKRHSLPSYNRRSGGQKKSKFGEINAGVRHAIKRPKPRRSLVKLNVSKDEKQEEKETPEVQKENSMIEPAKAQNHKTVVPPKEKVIQPVERPPSPVIDHTKRFFKTNRTLKPQNMATVTVSDKIKLKVSDGKIALKEKKPVKHLAKKPKLDISFDTTDLAVDEPEFNPGQQSNVADILKVLEDDWADDEYDTMGPLVSSITRSPVKSTRINDSVLMSPASVLSDMTSSMNIGGDKSENSSENSSQNGTKLFPLFNKGFKPAEDPFEKKTRGVKRQAWQLSARANDIDQYQLDAGQKKFGTTQCLDCGIVYQIGEPEDENAHLNFHNSVKTLKFNGWKNERIVVEDTMTGSRIITIEKSDPKSCWKKVEEVLGVVDRDLGLADMELTDYHDKKIYLYIRNKTILGVLVAESVKVAHKMIPEITEVNCCSEEETQVKCGINVIWTAMSHRRQRIASKLLDALRTNYYYGYILSQEDIAFSMPTPTGRAFAEKYTGTRAFKVYS